MESSWDRYLALKCACVNCITELVVNNNNAFVAMQCNSLYLLSLFLLPPVCVCGDERTLNGDQQEDGDKSEEECLRNFPLNNSLALESYHKLQVGSEC